MYKADRNAENYTFDNIKAAACIFVILIHCKFPGVAGDLFEALARFGVPMFFAISGYYLLKDDDSTGGIRKNMARKLKKTSIVTLKIWLIYTVYSFLYAITVNYGIKEWVNEKFNLFEFSRLLLFNSGKFIYDFTYAFDHLWYLFALIYVYLLVFTFAPILKKGAKPISILLLGLLFFGELLKIYYPIRPFGISVSVWYVIRNWLFVGVPFTLLGYWMHEDKAASLIKRPHTLGMLLVITGVFFTFFEYKKWGQTEVYFGSLLIVVGLLLFGDSDNEDAELKTEQQSILSKQLSFIGKNLSANIYFFHVMVISFLGWCVDRINPDFYGSLVFMTLRPIIVITITILISYCFYVVKLITTKNNNNLRK
ncbi:acyltransferase [Butyrivibrio sp. INlla16]|uniref:acyltransferase family protein n=1 Tax=Butyrivibrio sp. INlla16 TaxID=1520807 RepID=UPI0008847F51|nr:acyltransferase [Butyrivibrio sp. INlla16]SDB17013.1 Peptidoglycan/LPS O-acetylase OafA/YrhL, contains acyltransferase and SGNH-hydrolase domains [Butyrivibrio sp. INlla16]